MEHGNSTSTSEDDANTMDLYLLGIIGIVVLMWFAFGVLGQLVEKMIIWIYPAYCSILALKMESPEEEDGNKWLTYWITLAIVDVMEDLLDSCLPCFHAWRHWRTTGPALSITTILLQTSPLALSSEFGDELDIGVGARRGGRNS